MNLRTFRFLVTCHGANPARWLRYFVALAQLRRQATLKA